MHAISGQKKERQVVTCMQGLAGTRSGYKRQLEVFDC